MGEPFQYGVDFGDLADANRPVDVSRLSSHFPKVLRTMSLKNLGIGDIRMKPQSGEMNRFGVYFWGINQSTEDLMIPQSGDFLLISTAELLTPNHVNSGVLRKGVVVFPSPCYTVLIQEYAKRFRNPFDADYALNHDYIVLDLQASVRGTPPIITIPAEITVNRGQFNRR